MEQVNNIFNGKSKGCFDISNKQLETILFEHKQWLESKGEEGARANLSNLDLRGIDLKNSSLMRAILRGVNLSGVSLEGADLREADLAGSSLEGVNLKDAKITGTNFEHTNLKNAILDGVEGLYANFTLSNLENSSFIGATLEGVNLSDTNSKNANFSNSFLKRGDFNDSVLCGANFSNADLENSSLTRANLSLANITNANLENVDFREANMDGVNLLNANVENTKGIEQRYFLEAKLQEKQKYADGMPEFKTPEINLNDDDILSNRVFFFKQTSWFSSSIMVWFFLIFIFTVSIGYKLYTTEFTAENEFRIYEWLGVFLLLFSVVGMLVPSFLKCRRISAALNELVYEYDFEDTELKPINKKGPSFRVQPEYKTATFDE